MLTGHTNDPESLTYMVFLYAISTNTIQKYLQVIVNVTFIPASPASNN